MTDARDPEMKPKCRDVEPLLAPYADGESVRDDRSAVDAHVAKCPPCRSRVEEQRAVRDVLQARRGELRVAAPASLRARCEAQGRRSPLLSRRMLVPLSLAATLALAIAGVFLFGIGDRGAALAAQINRDHVRCFEARPPAGQAQLDAAEAAHQFTQTHGWGLRVPPASDAMGLELLAVRRCLSADGGSAHVMYRWRGEPLSLYVVPRPLERDDEQTLAERFGQQAVVWTRGSRTYVVLSAAEHPDRAALDRVAAHMQRTAE